MGLGVVGGIVLKRRQERKQFFFEKKNQKTFASQGRRRYARGGCAEVTAFMRGGQSSVRSPAWRRPPGKLAGTARMHVSHPSSHRRASAIPCAKDMCYPPTA
jgi:hypothetical protein